MAFTITSQTNLAYNEQLEGLSADDSLRRALSQGFAGDAAAKGGVNPFNAPPQFRLIGQTTAAETGAFTLNLAASTRTVNDPQASPSNPLTKQLGPLAGALTTGVGRSLRCRVKQVTAGVVNIFWVAATFTGGATPTVGANPLTTSKLGTSQNAADTVSLTAAAGSVTVNVVAGGAVTTVWTVDVFTDDPQ